MKNSAVLLTTGVLAMSIGLVGCGGNAPTSNSAPQKSTASETKSDSNATKTNDGTSKHYKIATVVKLSGLAWFNRMEVGIKKYGKETGDDVFMQGPPQADAAQQAKIIESLIAQKVNAIIVDPISPESLEPVLKRARDQGIVVISHEAPGMKNVDYDLEAFDNADYGKHFMDQLAKDMGEKGDYAAMVGSLTAKSHNQWVDAEVAQQKAKYSNMKLVADRVETNDDQKTAHDHVKELLKAHPTITGIQGSAMTDVPGIALAVEEMGLQGKVHIVGTSLVSVAGQYLKDGTVDSISFWDPADVGYVTDKIARDVLEHKEIKDGMDLGVTGYDKVKLVGNVIQGKAWIDVDKSNMDKYNF